MNVQVSTAGIYTHRVIIDHERLRATLQLEKGMSLMDIEMLIAGLELNGFIISIQRLIEPIEFQQDMPLISMNLSIGRIQAQRLVIGFQRFFMATNHVVRFAFILPLQCQLLTHNFADTPGDILIPFIFIVPQCNRLPPGWPCLQPTNWSILPVDRAYDNWYYLSLLSTVMSLKRMLHLYIVAVVRLHKIRTDEQQNDIGCIQMCIDLVLPLHSWSNLAITPRRHLAQSLQRSQMFLKLPEMPFIFSRIAVKNRYTPDRNCSHTLPAFLIMSAPFVPVEAGLASAASLRRGRPCVCRVAQEDFPLSPTETLFDREKNLIGGRWRNTGVSCGEKKANNWPIVQRPGCESGDKDHDWPS